MGLRRHLAALSRIVRRPRLSRRSLLLTAALLSVVTVALLLRTLPVKYGYFLNEFDPYWDYYATRFLVERTEQDGLAGWLSYFSWRDTRTWFPEGRNVAATSQVGLHFAGAATYLFLKHGFGATVSLYDWLVLFPVVAGTATTLVLYLLVRKIAGVTAGVFAGLVFAVAPPVIQRGNLGWFKSEPLALLLLLLGAYGLLTVYDEQRSRRSILARSLLAGALLGYANSAWGGAILFTIVVALLFLLIPFTPIDAARTLLAGTALTSSLLLTTSLFPRTGPGFLLHPVGLLLLASLAFNAVAYQLRRATEPGAYRRSLLKLIFTFGLLGLVALSFGVVIPVSGRYLTVVLPGLRSENPLVESVAEHFVPTGTDYFASFYLPLFLAVFGALVALRKRTLPYLFATVLGLAALYVASGFSRLLVFAALAVAVLGGIGFVELTAGLITPRRPVAERRRVRLYESRAEVKAFYAVLMTGLLTLPLVFPVAASWLDVGDVPVSIANAGTGGIRQQQPDWLEALAWMRANTAPEAVFAAWWDYGYWLTVMGNRTSLADNATINQTRIAQLGRMFMAPEAEAVRMLRALRADYVVVFVAGQKIQLSQLGQTIYLLGLGGGAGGDESKKQWFIRIGLGKEREPEFVRDDGFTPTDRFWEQTLLGRLFPFTFFQYVNRQGQLAGSEYPRGGVTAGSQATYLYTVKYPGEGKGPLRLAFASSSLTTPPRQANQPEIFTGVLVYRVGG